jgi:hypothetical protein
MIGYPAIHKHHGNSAQSDYDWQERLLPNVIYEDFKTIQKIEAALAAIGVRDYSSVTTDHPSLKTARHGNRIWLCVPRNEPAQRRLNEVLADRARFRFVGADSRSRELHWRRRDGQTVVIRSPLATYLKQRPAGRTKWRDEFGHVRARDFAVVARFRTREGGIDYFDYFIGGIRGLGTWGAGWFIDRHPELLAGLVQRQCPPGDDRGDVQTILQVEFDSYRIRRVVDVGDRDQPYFDHEMQSAQAAVGAGRVRRAGV